MAFKTHISNATGNQPGQVTTLLSAVLSEGVYDVARLDFKVSGTAGMAVNIAKGEAFVQNDSYVYGSQDQKFFSVASSTTQSVVVNANASGNPRIDSACIKVDTAITPGVQGATASSVVVVQGTASASPVPPTIPDNYLLLANIAVANGASSIVDANITDLRKNAGIRQTNLSWETLNYTFTYVSADDPTYVMQVASTDISGYVWAGMRVRVKQAGVYLYFIVTKVVFSTNTTITMYGGTDYDLANATIQEVGVSIEKAPIGFPLDPIKWTVITTSTADDTQASPAVSTWYNLGSRNIVIPIGTWRVEYQVVGKSVVNGAAMVIYATLSTATNSQSDADFTSRYQTNGATDANFLVAGPLSKSKYLNLTSKTTYYLNGQVGVASAADLTFLGSGGGTTVIRAICAYL